MTVDPLDSMRVALRADLALLLAPGDLPGRLRVMERAGEAAEHLPDEVLAPAGSSLARVVAGTLPSRLPRLALVTGQAAGRSRRLGPAIVIPARHPALGDVLVVVARQPPSRPFDDGDLAALRGLVGLTTAPAQPLDADDLATLMLRAAFDVAPAGMSLVDTALSYQWVNVALCAMLGRDREELLTLSVTDVVHPDHRARAVALYERLHRGEAAVRERLRFRRPDGGAVWADVGGSVFPGATDPRLYLVQQFDVTANQEHVDQLLHRAMHDDLTGLANRVLLRERLQAVLARRGDQRAVAFYLDLDGFKGVNDTYGHSAGDSVLRETARRLAAIVREGDTVARVGGDEFVVAGEVLDVDEAGQIARRIGEALRPCIDLDGRSIRVSVSVGVALSRPTDRPEDLVHRADLALLAEKGHPTLHLIDGDRSAGAAEGVDVATLDA